MKNKYLLISALIAMLTFAGCNSDDEIAENSFIQQINYSRLGGWDGYEKLSVTKSTISYELLSCLGQPITITKNIKTPVSVWKALISTCDISAFFRVQSGKTYAEVDGVDHWFSITSINANEVSFVNGIYDENYEKLLPFFDFLLIDIRGSLLEEYFCDFVNADKIGLAAPVINLFFKSDNSAAYQALSDEQKIQLFVKWVKSYDCIVDVQIQCASCVKTLPLQSDVLMTFMQDGQPVTRLISISMGKTLCVKNVTWFQV